MKLTPEQVMAHNARLIEAFNKIREHEHQIVDMIFEKGRIEGITAHQLKAFVDSRLNICLQNIGIDPQYEVKSNPIADWFYLGISSAKIHDFFNSMGNQYHRIWSEDSFAEGLLEN